MKIKATVKVYSNEDPMMDSYSIIVIHHVLGKIREGAVKGKNRCREAVEPRAK